MEGILLVHKPVGPSSFDVVRMIRKLSGNKRVGHAGTLDPLASGLLVVCLGRYTKLAGYLTNQEKSYLAKIQLGIRTTTDDQEGEVIKEASLDGLCEEAVREALKRFIGPLQQVPPQYSAIKIRGKRSYALARAHQNVDLKPREVILHDLVVRDIDLPMVEVLLLCSKGFYVRSLARDVGEVLGVGAHAAQIHRVKSGQLSIEQATLLTEITKENIESLLLHDHDAVQGLEIVPISDRLSQDIIFGRTNVQLPELNKEVAIASCQGKLVAILGKSTRQTELLRVI